MKKRTKKSAKRPTSISKGDWDAVDSPPLKAKTLSSMRPAREVLPAAFLKAVEEGRVGRPKSAHPKRAVSLRLDDDILDSYRAMGPGWQTHINAVLREHMPL